MKLTEFLVDIGFNIDDKTLTNLRVSLLITAGAIIKFTNDIVKSTIALDNFEKRTNIAFQSIEKLRTAAELNNVSAESMGEALETIIKKRGELLSGTGNANAWSFLGINITEGTPEEVLQKTFEQLKKIDSLEIRRKRLEDLGLDTQLLNFVGKSIKDIGNINVNLFKTKEEQKALLDLTKSVKELSITWSLFKEKVFASFFPLKYLIELFTRIINIIYEAVDKTIGWSKALKILTITFISLAAIFMPFVAKIILLLAVIEDLYTYFKGGESVIGNFIKKLQISNEVLDNFKISIKSVKEAFKSLFDYLEENKILNKILDVVGKISGGFANTIQGIGKGIGVTIAALEGGDTSTANKVNKEIDKSIKRIKEKYIRSGHTEQEAVDYLSKYYPDAKKRIETMDFLNSTFRPRLDFSLFKNMFNNFKQPSNNIKNTNNNITNNITIQESVTPMQTAKEIINQYGNTQLNLGNSY